MKSDQRILFGKVTIELAREEFASRGLLLLEKVYRNSGIAMAYRCKKCGYLGQLRLNDLRAKNCGCRACGIKRRVAGQTHNIEKVRALLKREHIILLSKNYKNSGTPLRLVCEKCGNRWRASFHSLNPQKEKHTGCPSCSLERRSDIRRFTTKQVKKLLREKGIILLSEYKGSQHPIVIKYTECGHTERQKTWNDIQSRRGCGKCAKNARISKSDYLKLAKDFNGKLIRSAVHGQENSEWECSLGHQFSRPYTTIKHLQTFCTQCSGSYSEMLCKAIVEKLFTAPFRLVRLKAMRSSKGKPLELDIYNSELGIAVEHNGAHHYLSQNNWGGEAALSTQRKNDKLRRVYCKKHGILLIEIRELGIKTSIEQVRTQIRSALKAAKRRIPRGFDSVDLTQLPRHSETQVYWEKIQVAATKLGFKILPCVYHSADTPIPVECRNGHSTMKTPRSFLAGKGCDERRLGRNKKPVRLSDGRVFESGMEAALVLGVTKERINVAARTRRMVNGFLVERIGAK